jgi:hypothetical protein
MAIVNELVHQLGAETLVPNFEPYPLEVVKPLEVAEVVKVRKPRQPKVKMRGRPRVYNGTHRRQIAAALRKHGLTKGLIYLAKEKKLKVSLTLARSVAEEFGIFFQVGRPKAA